MHKLMNATLIFSALIAGATLTPTYADSDLVEVRLVDNLDDSRGYCLDIAGGRGTDAPLDKGLQAHTCYDYTGGLLEDQSFDPQLIEKNQFSIPYFDVCMAVPSIEVGSAIVLAACESVDTQQFSMETDGRLTTVSNTELCVTASATEKQEGRGGEPVHVMRPLSLQPCSEDSSAYQTWTVFKL